MSSTSIGTGSGQDANENHPIPADHWPSRTLGADAPAGDARRTEGPSVVPGEGHPGQDAGDSSTLPAVDLSPEQVDQAFPEGPNVAPSPWEEEAARGRS